LMNRSIYSNKAFGYWDREKSSRHVASAFDNIDAVGINLICNCS